MPSISFIIRAYNEREKLRELIESIRAQDFPQESIELIVVDNGSTDGTKAMAEKLGAKVVHLAQKDFTYPKSLNVGCEVATNELLVMVSAHCLLWKSDSLRKAVKSFEDPQVAGIYGPLIPRPPYTPTQWIIGWIQYWPAVWRGIAQEKQTHLGILGNTNSMIRRSLWLQHPFSKEYGMGAEDYEWAGWALKNGYAIVKDPAFTVRHSHYLGLFDSIRQQKHWMSTMKKPRSFNPAELVFRKDIPRDSE